MLNQKWWREYTVSIVCNINKLYISLTIKLTEAKDLTKLSLTTAQVQTFLSIYSESFLFLKIILIGFLKTQQISININQFTVSESPLEQT